jgi:hypothetical protein
MKWLVLPIALLLVPSQGAAGTPRRTAPPKKAVVSQPQPSLLGVRLRCLTACRREYRSVRRCRRPLVERMKALRLRARRSREAAQQLRTLRATVASPYARCAEPARRCMSLCLARAGGRPEAKGARPRAPSKDPKR